MTTIKSYTDISQSKKLTEILPLESADMGWYYTHNPNAARNQMYAGTKAKDADIPCWSLAALVELMPPYLFEWERGIDLNIYRNLNGKGWHVSYMPNNINDMQKDKFRQITNGDTLIDAAYNMVCWLIEQGYIKKEVLKV